MKLFLVPTPIGNMEDITLRAIRVLREADFVLCEDTRTTKNLLKHYELDKRCMAYHIHNEHQQLQNLVAQIKMAESVALVSDAGTPGISDPGFLLLRECVAQGIDVECPPGATALMPAVVNSGLPCDSFYFNGFLPHKKGKESTLRRLAAMAETVIFYESPHRLAKTLSMMLPFFGAQRPVSISRELTKIHEETFRGTLEEAISRFPIDKEVKGEIVVVVGACRNKTDKIDNLDNDIDIDG
ncbi:MAG: 16S rRNA (cytidine(1402)-2'-O)-methyltransferase [Bacteroidales bacterium]|nr:16S rRNA (cytidine(1402)-2'-O)-methyltransferase [Bacteroidales bacterium]